MPLLMRHLALMLTASTLIASMTAVMFAFTAALMALPMPFSGKVFAALVGTSALAFAVVGGERLMTALD